MKTFIAPGGRQAVDRMIADHVGADARLIHDADGAPMLAGAPLHISISHSPNFAALALDADNRIGIDIEEPRLEQLSRIISKFLTPPERPRWQSRLLRAWTAKEATFKAAGIPGLTIGRITLSTDDSDIATTPDGRQFLLQFTETPDYTLCTAQPLTAEALYHRGQDHWQHGRRARALSDFNRSARLDPTGPGAAAAGHLTEIFDFYNPDLYNP